ERTRAGSPRRAGQIVEDVVAHHDVVGALTWRVVVDAEDVHAAGGVADDVALEGDALHHHPWRAAALVARRPDDRIAGLIGDPEVLEDVALDRQILSVLQLEEVLDRLLRGLARRAAGARGAAVDEERVGGSPVHVLGPRGAPENVVLLSAGDRRP